MKEEKLHIKLINNVFFIHLNQNEIFFVKTESSLIKNCQLLEENIIISSMKQTV